MYNSPGPPLLPQAITKVWLNTQETAEMVGTSPEVLAVWRCKGEYPDLRWKLRGRRVFYLLADVMQFIADCPYGSSKKQTAG